MDGLIPVWITSCCTAIGVIYAIVRNGSRGRKQDDILKAELKSEVGTIKDQLNDPDTGLKAIKKSVEAQRLHCVEVSTRLEGRVETNSSEIANLRKEKR